MKLLRNVFIFLILLQVALPLRASIEECIAEAREGMQRLLEAGLVNDRDAESVLALARHNCTEQQAAKRHPRRSQREHVPAATARAGAGPTGGHWIRRPDGMHQLWLKDADVHDGTVRVLFVTFPSLQQARDPARTFNIYVLLLPPAGNPELLHPFGELDDRHGSLQSHWLRRGHRSVLATMQSDGDGPVDLLELSLPEGRVTGRNPLPGFTDGNTFPIPGQMAIMADGKLVQVHIGAATRGSVDGIAWILHRPDGIVTGRGRTGLAAARLQIEAMTSMPSGETVVLLRRGNGEALQKAGLDGWPREFELHGRRQIARPHSVNQFLVIDAEGARSRVLASPLTVSLGWEGELALPTDLPFDRQMAQNAEQMELHRQVAAEARDNRSFLKVVQGGSHWVRLRPSPAGYAVLTRSSTGRRQEPPQNGWHFSEVRGADGVRDLRIEPALMNPPLNPVDFDVLTDGSFVVLAARRGRSGGELGHLVYFDSGGNESHRIPISGGQDAPVQLEMLAGSPGHYRAIGTGVAPGSGQALWVSGPLHR